MSTPEIPAGTVVFSPSGAKGCYVCPVPGNRHLVHPFMRYTDWDGDEREEVSDAVEIWPAALKNAVPAGQRTPEVTPQLVQDLENLIYYLQHEGLYLNRAGWARILRNHTENLKLILKPNAP